MTAGKVIAGRYELDTLIGSGGMGQVYRATDLKLRRIVAVKIMGAQLADDQVAVKRFIREMTATTMLEHENTIRVYDYGQTSNGELYLVMEHLEGETLARAIFDGAPMPLERVKRIGAQIARGLVAAHAHGIVHRDLKPGNVMIRNRYGDEDRVTILDFGIADLAGAARLTSSGLVAASAPYCSPEQANGDPVTPKSDLYMLGVVLYECVTGRLPFECDTHVAYLYAHVHKTPDRPTVHRPELPRWLDELIIELLAKAPEQRPESADLVARVLSQNDLPTNQVPVLAIERPPEPPPVDTNHATAPRTETGAHRRWIPWTVGAALLAGAGIGVSTLSPGKTTVAGDIADSATSRDAAPTSSTSVAADPLRALDVPPEDVEIVEDAPDVSGDPDTDQRPEDGAGDVEVAQDSDTAMDADGGDRNSDRPTMTSVWVDTIPSGGTVIMPNGVSRPYPTILKFPSGKPVRLTFRPTNTNFRQETVTWTGEKKLVVALHTQVE